MEAEDQDTHKSEYPYIRLGNSIGSVEWKIARKWVSRSSTIKKLTTKKPVTKKLAAKKISY